MRTGLRLGKNKSALDEAGAKEALDNRVERVEGIL